MRMLHNAYGKMHNEKVRGKHIWAKSTKEVKSFNLKLRCKNAAKGVGRGKGSAEGTTVGEGEMPHFCWV